MPEITSARALREKHFLQRNLPTIWCAGCGIGTVLASLARALDGLGLGKRDVVFSVGIGCSGFASRYLDYDVAHTTHGRALTVATGIKLANPRLKVICITGDGDGVGIGGNHFIHAARRNFDLTTVLFNNRIYGMTGGQYSPSTPRGDITATSPAGMSEGSFDICRLAQAAGAGFVGRATSAHPALLTTLIEDAIAHRGFSLVEALCQCPSQHGRMNRKGSPAEMMRELRGMSVRVGATGTDLRPGKIPIGLLHRSEGPELTDQYRRH